MAYLTMKQLLESGVHFGHQTRRWCPKMKPYIFGARNGIYIIDLQQTVKLFRDAYDFLRGTAQKGGTILFVGTKKQAQNSIEEEAKRCGMPYVNSRWLGGFLTNFSTIRKRIERLKELEAITESPESSGRTKKELLLLSREKEKLEKYLGGVRHMMRAPDAIFIVDSKKESIAIKEARKLNVPVVAIVDTNCDPDEVDWVIPGNDDAIRAIKLFATAIADACLEGKGLHEEKLKAQAEGAEIRPTEEAKPEAAPEEKGEPAEKAVGLKE